MGSLRPDRRVRRRPVLAAVGGLAPVGGLAGLGAIAGCLGGGEGSVTVLAAGSLARTFEEFVGPAFEAESEVTVHGEYYGTNAILRIVEDRTKHPDVIVSADATLLRDRLYGEFTDWDVEFATNSVGIGYDEETQFGRDLDDGVPWYDLAREADPGDLTIGDPNLDPLGYRAVQAFDLAATEYDLDGFREELLELVYVEPDEPQMMAGVDGGSRAAAIVYRNMAVDHGLPFFAFPDEYNFSNPALADHYATVEYTTDEGYTARGRPVVYTATVNDGADESEAGLRLVQFLIDEPEPLEEAGLTVGEGVPRPSGEVPEGLGV